MSKRRNLKSRNLRFLLCRYFTRIATCATFVPVIESSFVVERRLQAAVKAGAGALLNGNIIFADALHEADQQLEQTPIFNLTEQLGLHEARMYRVRGHSGTCKQPRRYALAN